MEILVINLMRLGDLIQAGPVLRGLRGKYPKGRLTLVAMDVFEEPARLLPGVDRLLIFPSMPLAESLDGSGGWPEAFSRLRAWFEEHLYQPTDLVVNLTPNLLGAIFTLAAGGKEVRGLALDSTREIYTSPSWASYALVVSKARIANPFNIVDLFVGGAGLRQDGAGLQVDIPPKAQAEADAAIKGLALAPGTALVGLCPGASAPARQWPPASFARMARLLSQARPCHFVIFGSSQEAPLGEIIRSQLPAAEVTLCQGRTLLPGLAAYLKHLDLLVTNDTGPMHLAAAVGTPVAALFLATARALDTGPAGRGHIAIEPDLDCHPCLAPCGQPRCQIAIRPEAVAELVLGLLEKSGKVPEGEGSHRGGVRVYVTEIDPLGRQAFLPLKRQPLTRRDFWVWVHRLAWTAILDGKKSEVEGCRSWVARVLDSRYLAPQDDLGVAAGQDILMEIQELAAQGESAACQMSAWADRASVSSEWFRQKLDTFAKLDSQLRRPAVEFPEIASIIEFFFQEQRRPGATEVIPLTRDLAQSYGGLAAMAATFQKTVQELATLLALWWGKELFPEVAQEMHHKSGRSEELPPKNGVMPCW
jgi:ADP-heptose:LPS heptosyltransferase